MRPLPRALLSVTTCLVVAGGLAACARSGTAATEPDGTRAIAVEISDAGCQPSPASVQAGPVRFTVTNRNSGRVTEAELLQDSTIIGEKENLSPGLSGDFSLQLKAGRYTMYCPNAGRQRWDFRVTGSSGGSSLAPAVETALDRATSGYQQYVIAEVARLVPATRRFTDAVRAGDVDRARQLYAPARSYYEEVEPVAESFGDLDPDIDARIDDVQADPRRWTGFHRLEKALWQDRSLAGTAPFADKLDADVAKLRARVATTTYQPAQLANGATELLNEVANTKVTGEEDRYSHTDLSDFAANVAGAQRAYELLKPALDTVDPALAATVGPRFADVLAALQPYRRAGGGYVDYSTVGEDRRRILSRKVDALAEPLSRVAAKVTG